MIVSIKTDINWMNSIANIPIVGSVFIFLIIFVIPVIGSFIGQAIIPGFQDDIGFTKILMILLPPWNILLWLTKIKLYLFFLPAWLLISGLALMKFIRMILE